MDQLMSLVRAWYTGDGRIMSGWSSVLGRQKMRQQPSRCRYFCFHGAYAVSTSTSRNEV